MLHADNDMAVAAFSRTARVSSTHVGDDRNHHRETVTNCLGQSNYWAFQRGSLDVRESMAARSPGSSAISSKAC